MSDSNYVRQRDTTAVHGQTRDLTYPPLPEALTVLVYDNHTHLEIADGESPIDFTEHLDRASSVGVRGVIQVGGDLETFEIGTGDCFRYRPGTVHRVTALEDTTILEVSTPHLDDVVRLDDRYGRPSPRSTRLSRVGDYPGQASGRGSPGSQKRRYERPRAVRRFPARRTSRTRGGPVLTGHVLQGHVVGVLGLVLEVVPQVLAGALARPTRGAAPATAVAPGERERSPLVDGHPVRQSRRLAGAGRRHGAVLVGRPVCGPLGALRHEAMMSCARTPVCSQVDAYAGGMADDGPDSEPPAGSDELRDAALHEEIELVGQLVVAATSTSHRLTQTEIDRVLGVDDRA